MPASRYRFCSGLCRRVGGRTTGIYVDTGTPSLRHNRNRVSLAFTRITPSAMSSAKLNLSIAEALNVGDLESSVLARYQRKALAASRSTAAANTSHASPSAVPAAVKRGGRTPGRTPSVSLYFFAGFTMARSRTVHPRSVQGDRFIPARSALSFDGAHFALTSDAAPGVAGATDASQHSSLGDSFESSTTAPEEGAGFRRALAGSLLSTSGA